MLQGVVLILALSVLLANLLADVLYAVIDPRIRYR
jgi:ABC-type dipeptide/oligopeptide/nickel transport system permease component